MALLLIIFLQKTLVNESGGNNIWLDAMRLTGVQSLLWLLPPKYITTQLLRCICHTVGPDIFEIMTEESVILAEMFNLMRLVCETSMTDVSE